MEERDLVMKIVNAPSAQEIRQIIKDFGAGEKTAKENSKEE